MSSIVDAAVAEAKSLPELVAKLREADPTLAQALQGKALIASRSPWGTLAVSVLAFLAARLGLGWDTDTCTLIAGVGVIAGGYLMRAVTAAPIRGLFAASATSK
jgi:hypothetical protein